MTRKLGLLCLLVMAVVLVGTPGSAYAEGPATDRVGRAEVRFMEGMADHHQMALDMAEDCLKKASSADLKTMCQNIITAQSAEIKILRGYLLAWYQIDYWPMAMGQMMGMMGDMPMDMMHDGQTHMGGMHMGSGMMHGDHKNMAPDDPPMMMGMMSGLSQLEGRAYDVAWAEAMIDHHDDAVHMSQRLLDGMKDGGHADLRALAEKIIKDQTAEIETFEKFIAG